MNYNFDLLEKSKKTLKYISKELINFPKQEFVLKNYIDWILYENIELIIGYLIENNYRIKEKFLKTLLVKIGMLDFYILMAYEKKYISKKKYLIIGSFLLEEKKMVYGIVRYEKSKLWWYIRYW